MYYYGARYYDPRLSIFISVDPLAEETMEPYLYTGNNPIMFTDPTGMSKEGGEDFIYNKKEGTYHWDSNVSSPEDVCDDNIEYVGPNTEDVNKHHQKNNPFLSNFTTPKFGEDLNGRWQGEVKTHTPGFWENQSNGNIFQRSLYDLSNSFYTTYQLFIGRTVGNLTMRNLDGSSTSTEQGALGLYGVSATFTGGRFIASGAKYLSNLKLMYEPINLGKNGFVNFRIGIRNTRTNYQLRLERHQFNTNTGTKIHSTHINYGNNGKQHLLLNPKKAKKIKL